MQYFEEVAPNYFNACKSGLQGTLKRRELDFVHQKLNQLQSSKPSFSILDVGCAAGYTSHYLRRHFSDIDFFGIDPSPKMIQSYQSHGFKGQTQTFLEYSKSSVKTQYDCILMLGFLEFVPSLEQELVHVRRRLRPDGTVILLHPRKNLFNLPYFLFHSRFHKIYFHNNYDTVFQDLGLKVEERKNLTPFSRGLIYHAK